MTKTGRSSGVHIIWEHNRSAVDQIIQCIKDGSYCALLGPRFSGKTAILRHVEQSVQDIPLPCIYINLFEIQAPTQAGFFTSLLAAIADGVSRYTDRPLPIVSEQMSSAVFRDFLSRCVDHLGR
jgi:type II secretory pathway predicted ATPase ExeA